MLQRSFSSRFTNFSSRCLILIAILTAFSWSAWSGSRNCQNAELSFINRFETLQKRTEKLNGEKVLNAENAPVWINGFGPHKNDVIYLVHGFIGTPFEMRSTAERFISKGYTVVLDLLPGHGVSGATANFFTEKDLKTHIFSNLKSITTCSDRVHVIGFSTGATLLHHFLQIYDAPQIKTISLISPYYRPTVLFGDLLAQGAPLFLSTLPVDFAYTISHFPDIRVAYLDPNHYHQEIPLVMAYEINQLGEKTYLKSAKIDTPLLLLTSGHDKIASPIATKLKVSADFKTNTVLHFNPFYLAPHHLMADPVSPVADLVHQNIFDFILRN